MKKIAFLVSLCFAGAAYAGAPSAADSKAAPAVEPKTAAVETTVITPKTATWMNVGDPKKGPWVAAVQGDSQKEAFTSFLKLGAGGDSGWHTHSSDYSGVVIEGTATHQDQGGKEVKLTAGQAWTSKAGVNHRNTCTGKKDCVMFIAVRGPFSFAPMTADGKPVDMSTMKPTSPTN